MLFQPQQQNQSAGLFGNTGNISDFLNAFHILNGSLAPDNQAAQGQNGSMNMPDPNNANSSYAPMQNAQAGQGFDISKLLQGLGGQGGSNIGGLAQLAMMFA